MPLTETTIVDKRERIALMMLSQKYQVSEIARLEGVGRPTVYDYGERYSLKGREGLEDRSRAAKSCPHKTAEKIEELIVAERKAKGWGAKKIRKRLAKRHPTIEWPAVSTFTEIFKRRELIDEKPRRRKPPKSPFRRKYEASEPGELTTMDYKGEFRMLNGQYCYPLTMVDRVSRYILACTGLSSTSLSLAWPVFVSVFREYGLPLAMQSDNGSPFAGHGLARLSTLAVRLMLYGIQPVLNDPGRPEQNGSHERMHKDLKRDTTRPPGRDLADQQVKFNAFVTEYNLERPHEALDLETPGSVYQRSPREFPEKEPTVEFPLHYEVRRVSSQGEIKWRGNALFLSHTLKGYNVGLEEVDDGIWNLMFGEFFLAKLNETELRFV